MRAAMRASMFRFGSDTETPVTARAIDTAERVLKASAGTMDLDAAICRADALTVRQNAYFPVDSPPPRGSRITPERFCEAFAERVARPPVAD